MDGRRRSLLAACLLAGVGQAQALVLTLPDGRVTLDVAGGAGGELCVRGHLGSQGLDNCLVPGPSRFHVTNPPMGRAFTVSPDGAGLTWEELYGPRAANASLGTGGLTANLNRQGRLTGLNWPGPGLYDHVNYLNLSRELPNQGAPENAGSFGGLDGAWLTPAHGWRTVSQRYAEPDTQTLVTVLEHAVSGNRVTVTDVVHPTEDLLARNFRFREPPQSGFAYYANMNPTTSRVPRIPSVTDAFLDPVSDFATVYDAAHGAMLHFRPYTVDPTAATRLLTAQLGLDNLLGALAGSFGTGVYVAVAGQGPPEGFQAGLDTLGLLRQEAEGTVLIDPYYDFLDGGLSGAPVAAGKTAGALAGLPPDPGGGYTVFLSAADEPGAALAAIRRARERGFAAIREAAEADWRRWIGRARLPATADAQTLAVSRRALMTIRTAQDRDTGAILANTTPQTPYRQDWVRDGAFFNYALLLAGYDDMVVAHNDFYRRVYRIGGTWDSFYYPDGAEAGAVFPYEIDAQAFAIWGLWLPYAAAAAGRDYLARVYPAIEDTANALLLCTDPINDLQCTAPEDDAVQPTQGAQGAASVYLGYRTAIAAAEALGRAPNPAWARRADEIRRATLSGLCDADGCQGGRGGIYLAWPAELLDAGDPDTADLLQRHYAQFAGQLDERSGFQSPGIGGFFQYPMEALMPMALDWEDPAREQRLRAWLRWLTHDVVEPGVLHYGERIYRDGDRSYLHTVGFPHIWSGAEVYIAAAHIFGLEGCEPGREAIADAACAAGAGGSDARGGIADEGGGGAAGGCVLRGRGSVDPLLPVLLLLALVTALRRREAG